MSFKALKYLSVFTVPVCVYISFTQTGWLCFLPILYAFGFIPILELILGERSSNLENAEEEIRRKDKLYDLLLYLVAPVHFSFLIWFFFVLGDAQLLWYEVLGRTLSMGLLCGLFGINVAHELGHRHSKVEQFLAKVLLWSTQYTHFFIEHNEGHHKKVSTPEDPASARLNENLYSFIDRSVRNSYLSAWKIEKKRLKRKKQSFWSFHNRMVSYTLAQLALILTVLLVFDFRVMLLYLGAAAFGIILLETINYIEHYGLLREKVSEFRYEDTRPQHSWNSDHVVGRLLLYELSRHSDHHAFPHRKYQVLRHHDESPQMPTGYPGMMVLAAIPPLWFRVMNPLAKHYRPKTQQLA